MGKLKRWASRIWRNTIKREEQEVFPTPPGWAKFAELFKKKGAK